MFCYVIVHEKADLAFNVSDQEEEGSLSCIIEGKGTKIVRDLLTVKCIYIIENLLLL